MKKAIASIIVAVVTPFDENEEINEGAWRQILEFLIEGGSTCLVPHRQGEFFALSIEEKKRLIDLVVKEAKGRIFVMPHTGGITTGECIKLSRYAEAAGADAVSVITPFFIEPTQEEIYYHYREIAASLNLPVLAYNNPGRTEVNLLPETAARPDREAVSYWWLPV